MKTLPQPAKLLLLLLVALSFLLNLSLGLAIFFIWRVIIRVKKMAELETSGTQVMATVTDIETLEMRPIGSSAQHAKPSRKMYRLLASWQHPQTGRTYTLKAPIRSPEKFPIGSSVSFLVNYNNPRWHRLEDLMMEAYAPIKSDQPMVNEFNTETDG